MTLKKRKKDAYEFHILLLETRHAVDEVLEDLGSKDSDTEIIVIHVVENECLWFHFAYFTPQNPSKSFQISQYLGTL